MDEASINEDSPIDFGRSVESIGPGATMGNSSERVRSVSFADTANAQRPRSRGGLIGTFSGAVRPSSPTQQRIQELEAAVQRANTEREAAESRVAGAEERLANALAEKELLATQVADLQNTLALQQIASQQHYDELESAYADDLYTLQERVAAELERLHRNHIDYLRVLEESYREGRRGLEATVAQLHLIIGGFQAQLMFGQQQQRGPAHQTFMAPAQQRGPAANQTFAAPAQQRGPAANQTFHPAANMAQVPMAHPGFPTPHARAGVFHLFPYPVPSPPLLPAFAPSESTRRRNREARLANGRRGGPFRRRNQRGWGSGSD